MATNANIYQFKITLKRVKPKIWRRIQVPATFNFYALHSAILDAMGWSDAHLHQFEMKNPRTGNRILICTPSPDDDGFEERLMESLGIPKVEKVPEKNAKITDYFVAVNDKAVYEYDFGDGWEHEVVLERILPSDEDVEYPRCIAGKRACPPEDCGGVWGYEELLEIIADPDHEEYKEKMEWLEFLGMEDFDPDEFDPKAIEFEDAEERENFRNMFF